MEREREREQEAWQQGLAQKSIAVGTMKGRGNESCDFTSNWHGKRSTRFVHLPRQAGAAFRVCRSRSCWPIVAAALAQAEAEAESSRSEFSCRQVGPKRIMVARRKENDKKNRNKNERMRG